jgi:hypothetical protein
MTNNNAIAEIDYATEAVRQELENLRTVATYFYDEEGGAEIVGVMGFLQATIDRMVGRLGSD